MPSSIKRIAPSILLIALAACAPAATGNAATATPQSSAGPTIVTDGATVPVTLDTTTIAPGGRHEIKPLKQVGNLAAIVDSYASKAEGMSRCQAGQEVYFRVIDRAAKKERYAKLIESCAKDVVLGDPPFVWTGNSVAIALLSEPRVTVAMRADGTVTHTP